MAGGNGTIDVFDFPILCVDRIGRILMANQAFATYDGIERPSLRGRFLQEDFHSAEIPADYLPRLTYVVETGKILRYVVQSQGSRWFRVNMFPMSKHERIERIFICVEEISDVKRAEHAFRESQEQLLQITNALNDAFCVMELPGCHIVQANRSFCELFQTSETEILENPKNVWANSIHPDDHERVCSIRRTGSTNPLEYRILRRDGSTRWVKSHAYHIHGGKLGKVRTVSVISDITEEQLARKELHERERLLMQADKLSSLGVMVAELAHEVNNPNHLIGLNTELLLGLMEELLPHLDHLPGLQVAGMEWKQAREELFSLVKGIDAGSRRIQSLVDSLKHVAREEKEGMDDIVSLKTVVATATLITGSLLQKVTHHLEIIIDPGLPMVKGNQQQLEQVVLNLVTNAAQALENPEQAIRIHARLCAPALLELVVADEGPGIPREFLSRIFNPFFTTKQGKGGTGLGLSIAQRIVQNHGGKLLLSSIEGKGTKASILLPVPEETSISPVDE
jgi:PAS domain S-box-containing protein